MTGSEVEGSVGEPDGLATVGLLRELLDASIDVVVLTDSGGRMLYASDGIEAVVGRPPGACLHMKLTDLVTSETRLLFESEFASLLASDGARRRWELRLEHSEGSPREVDVVITNRLRDAAIGAVIVAMRDITGARRTEHNLAHLRDAYSLLDRLWADITVLPTAELDAGAGHALEATARHLGAEWAAVMTTTGIDATTLFSWRAPMVLVGPGRLLPDLSSLQPGFGNWLEAGGPIQVDLARLRRRVPAIDAYMGITGAQQILLVPGRWPDGLRGFVAFVRTRISDWTEGEHLATWFSDLAGAILLRQTAQRETSRHVSEHAAAERTLHRRDATQAALARVSTRFVNAPVEDTDMSVTLALGEVARLTNARSVGLWQVNAQHELVRTHGHGTAGIVDLEVLLHAQPLLRSGEPITVDEIDPSGPLMSLHGDLPMLLAPMSIRGAVIGLLVLHLGQTTEFSADELVAIRTIAEMLASTLARRKADDALIHQALHDPLTGLANRTLLIDRLEQLAALARRDQRAVSVLFVDLDRFKTINDTLGHDVGDRLLAITSARLEEVCRGGDTVGRFGGDEFVILMAGDEAEALGLGRRLREALSSPVVVGDRTIELTASIGVATHSGDELAKLAPSELVRHADIAMYRAKQSGRDRLEQFTGDMETAARERFELGNDLRRALERTTTSVQELAVWYQPLVHVANGQLAGVEALVRWHHPTRGLLGPNSFIGVAEDDGLIRPLGLWVMSTALQQLARWREPGSAMFGAEMSVNVSARQLPDPDLVSQVAEMLSVLGLRPELLHIELTESMLAQPDVLHRLGALRSLGVKLSIDDFGTGYSSLAYLRHLPADELKIDRTFVRNLADDHRDRALIKSVLTMAHDLGLTVVAEGVETVAQLDVLRGFGCDLAQGYLFARPCTPVELDREISSWPKDLTTGR